MDSPLANDCLWAHCFHLEAAAARERGDTEVLFANVDRRVLELSKRVIDWKIAPAGDTER